MENKGNSILISKDQVLKGLKMELTGKELGDICQQRYERYEYYDFDLLLYGLHKTLNKKVSFDYYLDWCILIANCLEYTNYKNKAINFLMTKVGDLFDASSFDETYSKKELLSNIAMLKYFNHLFNAFLKKEKMAFETDGVERILVFDHVNRAQDSSVLRAIIKDNTKKEFDLRYIDDAYFEYNENINYTFIDDKNFDNTFNIFFEDDNWRENHELKF